MSKNSAIKNLRPGEKYAQLHLSVFDSEECKALTTQAQMLLVRLTLLAHEGSRNGYLAYSHRQAAADCRIDKKTVPAKLEELQRAGFIELARVHHKNERKANEYRLTFFPSANGKRPTDDWKK